MAESSSSGTASLGRLDGKVALVTGASSGIGAGTAILFSKLGAELSIIGRNETNLKKTAEECEKFSGKKLFRVRTDFLFTLNNNTCNNKKLHYFSGGL
ncbi:hypothetical protein KUTeg_007455 [Tegillarca granosa]|uniref:Uncharacterized protein n=1 Tax=Tegillarca granosa TaxID=220873 RepID=A0ABQ9FDB6_TEGGR|nr:hypothetical protein KUTeg_007455 [Tegillarca granosa]